MKDIQNENLKTIQLHFTGAKNLESIMQDGLLPKIGGNANQLEETPKVFFSVGLDSLYLYDNWIKWFIYRTQKRRYSEHCENKYDTENNYYEYQKLANEKFCSDLVSGALFIEENRLQAYEKFYELAKSNIFLKLSLVDGVDYDNNDSDEIKARDLSSKSKLTQTMFKTMYGKGLTSSKKFPYRMERWNMHTKSEHGIDPSKIEQLSINGKTDMLSILFYLYEKSNNKNFDFLNEFIKYAKQKENILQT